MPDKIKRLIQRRCKPDALLVKLEKEGRYYDIVEVKYCRDTNPEHQEHRASAQHRTLIWALQKYDKSAKVRLKTVMLGVSGCIYTDTIQSLEDLGVTKGSLRTLLKDLHWLAIQQVERIWDVRQAAISATAKLSRVNWSKRKRELHTQAVDHRKRRKLRN